MTDRRPLALIGGFPQELPASDALAPLGAVNEAPIVTMASASTMAIGAAQANTIQVTGTTTITGFDTIASGVRRTLRFSGALTLTYDATKLILPRSANITTVAGDVAEFISLGGGNWACLAYERATAAAAKTDLALNNVDNTSDASKPISTATQTALNSKANISAPSFTDRAYSTADFGAFTASGKSSGVQTGFTLTLPSAAANKKSFEWLTTTTEGGKMMMRSINDAYTAAHEFFIAMRSTSNDHTMDRICFRDVAVVCGADSLNSNYRLQVAGGAYATGPVRPGQYTLSSLPSASAYPGSEIDVTDAAGGAKRCRSDGTSWKILNTTTPVS